MKVWGQRLGASILGLVLILIIGEVALRLLAIATYHSGYPPSRFSKAGPAANVIRIVALGESTTAPFREPASETDISWPSKLEARLNAELSARKSTMRARVENLAKPGVSSVFQVNELRRRIQEEPVDVLITMLGVNDARPIIPEDNFWYRSSYLVRWVFWALELKGCPSCFDVETVDPVPSRTLNPEERFALAKYMKVLGSTSISSPVHLQHVLEEFAKLETALGPDVIFPVAIDTGWILFSEADRADVRNDLKFRRSIYHALEELLERFRPQVLRSAEAVSLSCYLAIGLSKSCLPLMVEAVEAGLVLDDRLLSFALNMNDEVHFKRLNFIFKNRGLALHTNMKSLDGVRANYQALGETMKAHGFLWFAMQYPSGTAAGLQWLMARKTPDNFERFENVFYLERGPKEMGFAIDPLFEDVVLVSNRNFVEKTKKEGLDKYYRDLFARAAGLEFGHTTEAGYDLIVENLMKEILPRLPEIEARAAKHRSD